jgi:hypothetical protein
MRNGAPKCVCAPDCSGPEHRRHGPVCGSDGRTYRNHCALLKHNCKKRRAETIAYQGRCQCETILQASISSLINVFNADSCDRVTCDDGKYCVTDQNALPHCIPCQMECASTNDASTTLCGGDGVTYASMCHLMRATCLRGRSIGVAYRGQCQGAIPRPFFPLLSISCHASILLLHCRFRQLQHGELSARAALPDRPEQPTSKVHNLQQLVLALLRYSRAVRFRRRDLLWMVLSAPGRLQLGHLHRDEALRRLWKYVLYINIIAFL